MRRTNGSSPGHRVCQRDGKHTSATGVDTSCVEPTPQQCGSELTHGPRRQVRDARAPNKTRRVFTFAIGHPSYRTGLRFPLLVPRVCRVRGRQLLVFRRWGLRFGSDWSHRSSRWCHCFERWGGFLAVEFWIRAHPCLLTYELAGWVRRIRAQDLPRCKRNLHLRKNCLWSRVKALEEVGTLEVRSAI